MKRLRIAVLTQQDGFVIPENIKLLGDMDAIDLVAVVKIDAAGSLTNNKFLFLRGFGMVQFAKMGLSVGCNSLLNFIDLLFSFKLGYLKSLKSVSVVCNSEYKVMRDPNDASNIDWLSALNVDLIVSFSAPCVFRGRLLRLPKIGCINLHCSLLPRYAGLLPSFWALYDASSEFGATVHEMDDKIDNGSILGQVKVRKPLKPSMFNVIKDTKRAGGELMVTVVQKILDGSVEARPNNITAHDYFSWPTVEQMKSFRKSGGRLI